MPYTNAQATPRQDIWALVMQANADFNKMFIADKVFPVKTEDFKRGIYMKANLSDALLLDAAGKPREAGAAYPRTNRKYDTDTYDCQEYGEEAIIDDSYEEEVERFMNLEATEAMLLERKYRLYYEMRVATQLFNATTFNATAATAAYTQANLATIDVSNDVDLAKGRLLLKGLIANAVVMNYNVFQRIRRSTLLQNQIYGVVPRGANQRLLPGVEDVARALGVDYLFVGMAPYATSKQGQTFASSYIWPSTYISVCVVQGGEYEAGGVGRTIQWAKDTTGLFTPETYRSNERRSNVLRVRQHTAEKVIDATAAELITTSYA